MRLLAFLSLLLAIVFYIIRIFQMLRRNSPSRAHMEKPRGIDSRIRQAKPAQVIEVKTVVDSDKK
jgi:hypothetical protein